MKRIILASQSPRRRELLGRIIDGFEVMVTHADESVDGNPPPQEYVMELALRKARAISEKDAVVIGSDTVVALDGEILEKPESREHARRMLKRLSGREHTVYTGVAIKDAERELVDFEATRVLFDELSDDIIDRYIATGEPMDKAGAYGIQSLGCALVKKVDGDYANVVGLPLFKLIKMLEKFGIDIF